jgi:hypothetical protein
MSNGGLPPCAPTGRCVIDLTELREMLAELSLGLPDDPLVAQLLTLLQ